MAISCELGGVWAHFVKVGLPNVMTLRAIIAVPLLLLAPPAWAAGASTPSVRDLERGLGATVQPFLERHCNSCHGGEKPKADLDLRGYTRLETVVRDSHQWETLLERLVAKQMPPETSEQPPEAERQQVIHWIEALRTHEARKNAGDPGLVLARRLSNAEYNYTIRDLTGVDIRPTREFPVDPANPAGFDNSGESLAMSPALLGKYLQAAREVANHLVFRPDTLAFAAHPMLVETDRDKYCVTQIVDFYKRHATDFADYFHAAWRFKHRAALGKPKASLAQVAAETKVSPKYLALIWRTLETREQVGPIAKLQTMWRELPPPAAGVTGEARGVLARAGSERMRAFVTGLREKIEPRFEPLSVAGMRGTAQPFLMWKNRQYAAARTSYDRNVLQIDGKADPVAAPAVRARPANADDDDDEDAGDKRPRQGGVDPDLKVPAADRARYEAAFARFAAVFPDAFYVAERGRNYLDTSRDKGRYLSAGFHNLMGYFRDDKPLYEMILDEKGKKELDALWHDLDYVALGTSRTYVQFYFSESGEARKRGAASAPGAGSEPAGAGAASGGKAVTPPSDDEAKDVTTEPMIKKVKEIYLARVRPSGNEVAMKAVREHFDSVNATVRWVEKARHEAEPKHLEALTRFAAQAYRRPLDGRGEEGPAGLLPVAAGNRRPRSRGGHARRGRQRADVAGLLLPHRPGRAGAGRAAAVGPRAGQPAELLPLVEHARRRAAGRGPGGPTCTGRRCWCARPGAC